MPTIKYPFPVNLCGRQPLPAAGYKASFTGSGL